MFLFFFTLCTTTIKAQHKLSEKEKDSLVFRGNHFGFEIARLETAKARVKRTSGNYPISSSLTPGAKLAVFYHINFNQELSLNIGGEATVVERNFIVDFHKNDFSPPLIEDYHFTGKRTRVGDLLLNLPITIEKRVWYKNKQFLSLEAGVNVNISTGADADISDAYVQHTDGSYSQAAEVNVYANNDAKPWLSYVFNAGNSWRLKNNNLLQLGITANVSFTKYVNGTYTITIPNKPLTSGTYSSTGTYVGLCLRYSLTNTNYRLRKLYEKEKKNTVTF
ncbi:MAG: hypothetical protein M3R72_08665 [Bacteroidota bacterium]|nr:hypothetical protein [Bacteroidota bacterium]